MSRNKSTPAAGPRAAWSRGRRAASIALVAVLAAAVYAPVLRAWFLNDDFSLLLGGRAFDGARLFELSGREHFYRPLIELYFAAAVQAAGYSSFALHAVNLSVHALNGVLLLLLAARLTGSSATGLAAAVVFVTLPGYSQAVGWVAAITALLTGTWFLAAAIAHARYLSNGRTRDYACVVATVCLALATHESAVMLVPLLAALERLGGARAGGEQARPSLLPAVVRYAPLCVLLAGYLLIAWYVNARNYVVTEGHYAFGWHAVKNALDYVVSMYVGKRGAVAYTVIPLVTALVLWRGSPVARFAVWWMVFALAPVVWFTWGNASRYLYVPSIGFSLLLAEGARGLALRARPRLGVRVAGALVVLLVAAGSVRFAVFSRQAAGHFVRTTEPYREYARRVRAAGPSAAGALPQPGPGVDARYAALLAELAASDAAGGRR